MRNSVRTPLCVGLFCLQMLLVAAVCTPALAQEADPAQAAQAAQAAFDNKFGQQVRMVRQTKTTGDDAEFAQRLYTEAESGQHAADLTLVLYEKTYEFGLRDSRGYAVANQALDKLLEKDATRGLAIGEMRLELLEKWNEAEPGARNAEAEACIDVMMQLSRDALAAGDSELALKLLNRVSRFAMKVDSPRKEDVKDTISDLVRTRKAIEEIAQIEALIGTDATAADQLALVYLAHLDNPAKAAGYAEQMQDQAFAAKVRLAAKEFKLATPAEASEAGAFYLGLFNDNKSREPIAMLIRANVWLTEYLSREPNEPDAVKAAHEMLGQIDQALLQRGIGQKLARKMSSLVRGEGQFDRPADVQAAIDKAVAWLYTQHNEKTHWEVDAPNHRNWGGYTALVVYAMLMADEDPRVNGDLSRATHFMMNTEMQGTYPLCFRVHAWEVMPRRERYQKTLANDVLRLRNGMTKHGFWGYTMSGKDVVPGSKLDMSTTLAGGLGLWIGEAVGGITPNKANWERLARAIIECQLDDNGWSYNPAVNKTSMGAMTAGALALLHASYPHLGSATKEKADLAIERGMKWMDANFSSTTNVNRGNHSNYYFAAVQHAGLFAGRRHFREQDWYESIAAHLVKTQAPNGAWNNVSETAFAIAFLCRGGIVYEPSSADDDPASSAPEDSTQDTTEPAPDAAPDAPPAPDAPAQ